MVTLCRETKLGSERVSNGLPGRTGRNRVYMGTTTRGAYVRGKESIADMISGMWWNEVIYIW